MSYGVGMKSVSVSSVVALLALAGCSGGAASQDYDAAWLEDSISEEYSKKSTAKEAQYKWSDWACVQETERRFRCLAKASPTSSTTRNLLKEGSGVGYVRLTFVVIVDPDTGQWISDPVK